MAYREVHRVELQEVLRRWQAGESGRKIAKATGLARNTVDKYLKAAEVLGLSASGAPPAEEQLRELRRLGDTYSASREPGPSEALLLAHREQISTWLVQERLQLTRIQELLDQRGCTVPYSSLRRFVAKHQLAASSKSTVRMPETPPGQFAELDFGRLGYLLDPQTGKRHLVWALIVVLSFSRHMFVWPLLHQRLEDVIEGLEQSWRFFGGVPHHLVLDNFPAAVAEASPLSPKLTRGFLEYAQFRGFLPDPARVRHPKDKPKVERMVPYVRERFFKGGSFRDLGDLRSQAPLWCSEVAGTRVHGTTRKLPLQVFRDQEQAHLLPIQPTSYQIPKTATLRVHLDHHVEFGYALYSVPSSLCPPSASVEVVADDKLLRIYYRGNLVKTHPLQARGGRSTDVADYPAEKGVYALRAPERLRKEALQLGPRIGEFVDRLLDDPLPWTRLRQAQKLIRLAERYTPERVDKACARALAFDLLDVRRVERILVEALDHAVEHTDEHGGDRGLSEIGRDGAAKVSSPPPPARFARPGSTFARSGSSVSTSGNPASAPTAAVGGA